MNFEHRFHRGVVILTAAAVALCLVASQGLASVDVDHDHPHHHGHFHEQGLDNGHTAEGATDDNSLPAHVHFDSFMPRIENLPFLTGHAVQESREHVGIAPGYIHWLDRPPKSCAA